MRCCTVGVANFPVMSGRDPSGKLEDITSDNHAAEYSYPAFTRTTPTGRHSLPFPAHCADVDSLTPPPPKLYWIGWFLPDLSEQREKFPVNIGSYLKVNFHLEQRHVHMTAEAKPTRHWIEAIHNKLSINALKGKNYLQEKFMGNFD